MSALNDYPHLSLKPVFEKLFLPEFDIANFGSWCAMHLDVLFSNETTLKKFYRAELENATPEDGLILP